MFPPQQDSSSFAPFSYQTFINSVLAPEAAILLIKEDLDCHYGQAFKVWEESKDYGKAVFDDDGDEEDF
jgi:hypothetical protein